MPLILDGTTGVALPTTGLINRMTAQADLISFQHVNVTTAHRDTIKAGFIPAWFQQQWGGGVNGYELVDAATGTPYVVESATGYIEQNFVQSVAGGAGNTSVSQGFKVSTSQSISEVWVKIVKVANPANNLELRIQADDGTGKPTANFTAITNGTATALSGKLFESGDASGAWYRYVFPTPCALTAGTQYHLCLKSSGAVDGTNNWSWMTQTSKKYPHGNICLGDAAPAWTATTTTACCFILGAATTSQTFQSGGIFGDGKAVFYEGSPLNQSNQRRADLADLKGLTPNNMTLLLRGTAHTKDKTIADMTYGLDHDRVVIRCAVTTGFPVLTVYDSAGTARTVTGTTDISSGNHDVAVLVTTAGCSLWVDGASQGTPYVGTITFDTLFAQGQIGSLWIGGGFALAPTWSGSSISSFTGLPSTLGWTYGGAATEANAFSVSGGYLYQNKAGITALQDAYYQKATAGFSNTNGGNTVWSNQIVSATNVSFRFGAEVAVRDGAKAATLAQQEYYVQPYYGVQGVYSQVDCKSSQHSYNFANKGSDSYLFRDGAVVFDGTNLNTSASATNDIIFGDGDTTSGENYDVRWRYMKYYTTAALLPQATAGSLSEWAIWTGDKTSILATLWNSGSPISVKQFCGLGVNWKRGDDGAWVHRVRKDGITSGPTSSTTAVILPEMEGFVLGDDLQISTHNFLYNSAGGNGILSNIRVDGSRSGSSPSDYDGLIASTTATYQVDMALNRAAKTYFGLHKVEVFFWAGAGTNTCQSTLRKIIADGRS